MLNREQILSVQDSKIETVEVPEWGGSVCVRAMSAKERDGWEIRYATDFANKNRSVRGSLCAVVICDENGNRLFTEQDIPVLEQKSAAALDRLFDVAMRMNGLRKQDVDELEKN